MKSRLTKFIAPCILLLVILAQAYSYNYLEISQLRPQSTHVWRQTDCTSFALNYYQDGLNPFKPRLHNQFNTNGVTLGEGPILYYAVGVLYAIFGADETVYRGFWLLIWIVGLFHLFKLLRKLLQDDFWAVMITSTVFTVPVIVFYVPNFLPNTPAMAFVFMAWYYFYRYTEDKKKLNLVLTVILFSIAGWVKAPALITYFALLGAGSIHQLFVSKQNLKSIINEYYILLIPFLVAFSWYSFTAWYAAGPSADDYLSAKLFPIWKMSFQDVLDTIEQVRTMWLDEFLVDYQAIVYGIMLLASLTLLYTKKHRLHGLLLLFVVFGIVSYCLIFFIAFNYHDYYTINVFILVPFIFSFTILQLQQYSNKYISGSLKIAAVLFLYLSTTYSAQRQTVRYTSWMNEPHVSTDLFDIEPVLRQHGIKSTDLVISVPDETTNLSLYLMNQKGFTYYNEVNLEQDSVNKRINEGTKYLVVNQAGEEQKDYLRSFVDEEILTHGEVKVFTLKNN